jgi:8-oxo-dGTP diphosphatase
MIYRLGFPIARIWWHVGRVPHEGALVATYVGEKVLLLRASYRRGWNFPGGGIQARETAEQAARREVQEEIGLLLPTLKPKGNIVGYWEGRRDSVHYFELRLERLPALHLDNREIVEARLVSPEELNQMKLTPATAAYFKAQKQAA